MDTRGLQVAGQVQINLLRGSGIGGPHPLALPQGQQVVFPHQAQHPLVIHRPTAPTQFSGYPRITVLPSMLQRDPLNLGPQLQLLLVRLLVLPMAVEPRPADLSQLTHALDTQAALHRHHLSDLLVDVVPPALLLGRRRAATLCKAPLKKSTSKVFSANNCLTCCSCSCRLSFSWSVGVYGCTFGLGSSRSRHRYKLARGTPSSLHKARISGLTFIRPTAYWRNSSA